MGSNVGCWWYAPVCRRAHGLATCICSLHGGQGPNESATSGGCNVVQPSRDIHATLVSGEERNQAWHAKLWCEAVENRRQVVKLAEGPITRHDKRFEREKTKSV